MTTAEIGVYGGSGFYRFLDDVTEVEVETPYGAPAAPVTIGEVAGRSVAFLPRHGVDHRFPAHLVPYRANAWAMKELGVSAILGPCSTGSLQPSIEPGDFVVCDQLVDRTWGREHTFCEGPPINHIAFADPYDEGLRQAVLTAARSEAITAHETGTVVVIQGPRFSTRAESRTYRDAGYHVINMTQCPEAPLAAELEIPYAAIALVTDYDAGLEGADNIEPVTQEAVFATLEANIERVQRLLFRTIEALPS